MMTHEHTLDLLDDYVAGELPVADEREVRRHLMQCDDCRAEERELRALLDEAAALPPEIQPDTDLWQGIAARLEPRSAAPRPAPAALTEIPTIGPRHTRRVPWWMQAAAAIALVVASSLLTMRFMPGDAGQVAQAPAQTSVPAQRAAQPAPTTALAAFRPAERDYERAIGDLENLLEAQRGRLAPQTVATVEANLRVIDKAIAESRAALAADPNSRELTRMLSDAYDAKIGVLRRSVQL